MKKPIDPNILRANEAIAKRRASNLAAAYNRDAVTKVLLEEERQGRLESSARARRAAKPNPLWCERSLIDYDHEKYGYLLEPRNKPRMKR